MGLDWVVALHEPINDCDGNPALLSAGCNFFGSWLGTDDGNPNYNWNRIGGFVFVIL